MPQTPDYGQALAAPRQVLFTAATLTALTERRIFDETSSAIHAWEL
jgi:hypothetical protein